MKEKNNNKKKKKEKKKPATIKERVAKMLDIPEEVASNRPKITAIGRKEVLVENYKGIIEFSNEIIRINSNHGIITITGQNMKIREITNEDIVITGDIENIDYIR